MARSVCSHYVTAARAARQAPHNVSRVAKKFSNALYLYELTRWHNLICLRTLIYSTCSPAAGCFSTRPFNHNLEWAETTIRDYKGRLTALPDLCHPGREAADTTPCVRCLRRQSRNSHSQRRCSIRGHLHSPPTRQMTIALRQLRSFS